MSFRQPFWISQGFKLGGMIFQTVILSALYVASTIACNGCHYKMDSLNVELCKEGSEKILDGKCESMELTDSCEVKSKCEKTWGVDLYNASVKVTGKLGNIPINFESEDICAEMNKDDEKGKAMREAMEMHQIPKCPTKAGKKESIEKVVKLDEKAQAVLHQMQGMNEVKIELFKINGDENLNFCAISKVELECAKHHRAPKKM